MHEVLTQDPHLLISERAVLYWLGVFLVLLRCTYHLRLEEQASYFRRHGLLVALDALTPAKGTPALDVVRALTVGRILQVVPLLSATHQTIEQRLLQPVKALGYRMRGGVSDEEKALVSAIAKVFAGGPHQTCQIPCLRAAATPIVKAGQACKKTLKKAIRGPFYVARRALSQPLAPDDARDEVLSPYADLIRSTLTAGSKPPFALGGLRVVDDRAWRLRLSVVVKRGPSPLGSLVGRGPTPPALCAALSSRLSDRPKLHSSSAFPP